MKSWTPLVSATLQFLKSRGNKRRGTSLPLLNEEATVVGSLAPNGSVLIHGELWFAKATDECVPVDQKVRVVGIEGHQLIVTPLPA